MADPLARALELVDAQVLRIATLAGGDATVTREYETPYSDQQLKSLTGRKVWVFPLEYDQTPMTRVDWIGSYRFAFVVVERYTATAERPPNAWLDERVKFAQRIYDLLEDPHQGTPEAGWCDSIDGLMPVYDPAALRELGMFWVTSPVFTYRMVQNP